MKTTSLYVPHPPGVRNLHVHVPVGGPQSPRGWDPPCGPPGPHPTRRRYSDPEPRGGVESQDQGASPPRPVPSTPRSTRQPVVWRGGFAGAWGSDPSELCGGGLRTRSVRVWGAQSGVPSLGCPIWVPSLGSPSRRSRSRSNGSSQAGVPQQDHNRHPNSKPIQGTGGVGLQLRDEDIKTKLQPTTHPLLCPLTSRRGQRHTTEIWPDHDSSIA